MLRLRKRNTNHGLSVVIVGCGKVGKTLVERLSKEGHDVTIIDKNPDKIADIMNNFDVMGLVGNGATYTTLREAGIEQADIFVALTGSDELNLLCCVVAKRAGHCEVIARVRTPDYSEDADYLKEKLGLAMIINPEKESARMIARILYLPTALDVQPFFRGLAEMVRIKLPSGSFLENKRLMDLSKELSGAVLICAIERDGEVYIPSGTFEIKAGDIISFISPRQGIKKFLKRLSFQTRHTKNVLIIGGGRSAFYLAKILLSMGVAVTIIETNESRCHELSELLPSAIVINGNGCNEDLLNEVGIQNMEAVISLTGIDEENILLTLHAKKTTDAKVITKINRINFYEVINDLDLGSVIYPKYMTTERIVAFVRSQRASMNSNIDALHYLFDEQVEAIEFLIEHESAATNKTLLELQLKDHVLVTCIERDGKVIIPGGNDMLQVGDSVVVVTTHGGFSDITDILR